MNRIEYILSVVDYALNTRTKKHVIGGVLMSTALLFGGLSITVLSLKMESEYDE